MKPIRLQLAVTFTYRKSITYNPGLSPKNDADIELVEITTKFKSLNSSSTTMHLWRVLMLAPNTTS